MIKTDIFFKRLRVYITYVHIYKYWEIDKGKEK